ncbi:MAG: hypothetical protein M1828_001145 [Chrysothrix sp. TS-e1954]|nr:MAG: hypothetical protein M1828_001145 [Chrysothrix sp. TS-e1954]
MANTTTLSESLPMRKSIYALSPSSPVPDSRIHELAHDIILHCPSSFNVQSARIVLLLGAEHQKLWKEVIPAGMRKHLGDEKYEAENWQGKLDGYATGYGSALFYDAPEAWDELWARVGEKMAGLVRGFESEWADHTSGMHQFALWSALEAEGLGANLQHYTWLPQISEAWGVKKEWKMRAQLVFGKPEGGRRQERTYKPVDGERLIVHQS